mgnify:FL=1
MLAGLEKPRDDYVELVLHVRFFRHRSLAYRAHALSLTALHHTLSHRHFIHLQPDADWNRRLPQHGHSRPLYVILRSVSMLSLKRFLPSTRHQQVHQLRRPGNDRQLLLHRLHVGLGVPTALPECPHALVRLHRVRARPSVRTSVESRRGLLPSSHHAVRPFLSARYSSSLTPFPPQVPDLPTHLLPPTRTSSALLPDCRSC